MSDETNPSRFGDSLDELMLFGDTATRRVFIKQVAGTSAALALGPHLLGQQTAQAAQAVAETVAVNLKINGRETALHLDPRVTLLDALRGRLGLMGSKKGCDHGSAALARCW